MYAPQRSRLSDATGSITVLVAAGCVALLTCVSMLAFVVSTTIATHKAQLAADMAAVSGAHAMLYGDDGCAQAGIIAQEHQAQLERCQEHGDAVQVLVSVRTWGNPGRAQARAGPRSAAAE